MNTTQRDPGLETLSEDTMAGDPMTQFAGWLAQAEQQGIPEPTAMVLATTSAEGRPRARTVLLKAHDADGLHVLHQPDLAQGPGPGGPSPGVSRSSPGTPWAAR